MDGSDVDYFDKRTYERRARGLRDVAGVPLEIEWGQSPATDGEIVYLPTPEFREPWDDEEMIKAAFNHEVAHVMFNTDIAAMFEFAERWGEKIDHPDPFGLVSSAAEHVIQILEDQRIEYLYGRLYYGARKRFEGHFRRKLHGDKLEPPSNALHSVRCGIGNDMNTYSPVAQKYGSDTAELFYDALTTVEGSSMEMTIYQAERVMEEIVGWYIGIIEDEFRESDVGDLYVKWERVNMGLDDGDQEAIRKEVEEEAHKYKRQFEEQRKYKNWMEEIQDEPSGEGDIDIDQTVRADEEELEEWEDRGSSLVDDIEEDLETEKPEDIESRLGMPVVRREAAGVALGEVDEMLVRQIRSELESIYGKRIYQSSSYGEYVDVDAVIRSEATPEPDFEWFEESFLTAGFSTVVLLDASWSMEGQKMTLCRDMGSTLFVALDGLAKEGYDLDFEVVGYSGHEEHPEMLIQEARTPDQARKIDVNAEYPSTPTWGAVRYADMKLQRKTGQTFIVLVTDGVPEGSDKDGKHIPIGRSIRYTRHAIATSSSPVFTIGIDIGLPSDRMSKTYGSYVNVKDTQEATETLRDFIRGRIREHIYMY